MHSEYGHDLSNVCEHLEVFKDSDSAVLQNDHMFITFTYPTGTQWQNESDAPLYTHISGLALGWELLLFLAMEVEKQPHSNVIWKLHP